jgi:hypothetical protein
MANDGNSFVKGSGMPKKKPSFEERKKDITQFIGVKQVTHKENAWLSWMKTMFFSDKSLKDILKDVTENQVVPQVKDMVRNSLVSTLDMKMYKDHKITGSSSGTPASFITNYVQYGTQQSTSSKLAENQKKDEDIIKSGYECPAFVRKVDAEQFLASMKSYVTKYQTMSVQDLAWMQGKRVDYTWDKYGWEANDILAIDGPRHIANPSAPWIIELPKAGILS